MFNVKRKEKANRIICSLAFKRVRVNKPLEYMTKQPMDEQVACKAVSNHGNANCWKWLSVSDSSHRTIATTYRS